MEYIQCQHCGKKYSVNDKLRAATGKQIRCKHCQAPFEIIIHSPHDSDKQDTVTPPASDQPIDAELETPHPDESKSFQSSDKEDATSDSKKGESSNKASGVKKKVNIHLLVTIMLALTLVASSAGTYLFFYHPELFQTPKKQSIKPIMPIKLVKPIKIVFPDAPQTGNTDKQAPDNKPVQSATTKQSKRITLGITKNEPKKQQQPSSSKHVKKTNASLNSPDHPSQICKDYSAAYWFRSHRLATSQLDTNTYMKLLDKNVEQAEKIRKVCRNKSLLGSTTKSAKKGQIPAWIQTEINALNKADQTARNQQKEKQQKDVSK